MRAVRAAAHSVFLYWIKMESTAMETNCHLAIPTVLIAVGYALYLFSLTLKLFWKRIG